MKKSQSTLTSKNHLFRCLSCDPGIITLQVCVTAPVEDGTDVYAICANRPDEMEIVRWMWFSYIRWTYLVITAYFVFDTDFYFYRNIVSLILGDSLSYSNGYQFTTKDSDNDAWPSVNCADNRGGAWWYNACAWSNLNGLYLRGSYTSNGSFNGEEGIEWYYWRGYYYSMKTTEMKISPSV